MGFTKRHITKDLILSNLDNIEKLLDVDVISMDLWSNNFISDLSPQQKNIRKQIIEENDSIFDYHLLDSLSEAIINLKTNPNWIDVEIVRFKTKFSHDETPKVNFQDSINMAYNHAIKYYDTLIKY